MEKYLFLACASPYSSKASGRTLSRAVRITMKEWRLVDFRKLTAMGGSNGRYHAEIRPELATPVGPFGGYVAALALRAAGEHTSMNKPSSFSCQFLSVADFAPVDVDVTTLRSSSRTEAMRVAISQTGKPILESMVWAVSDLPGIDHGPEGVPEVPPPEAVLPFSELFSDFPATPFFDHFEGRPIPGGWVPEGDPPWSMNDMPAGPPVARGWACLHPEGKFEDPFLEAGRLVMVLDWISAGAATMPSRGRGMVAFPSLDLTASFFNLERATEWLYCDAESPIARGGIVTSRASIWSQGGAFVGTGMQQMMQRIYPMPAGGPSPLLPHETSH